MACKDFSVMMYFSYILFRFRWVFCQLETLRQCFPPSVPRILAELPESLDETYERILQGIHKTKQRHAHRLLQCLTVAVRPLMVEELAEVLAIDFDAAEGVPKLNEGFRWADQEQAVLSACSSLVAIVEDGNSRRVQFSHFSVKEFLTSDRLATSAVDVLRGHHIRLEPAHTIMAQACLSVLLRLDHHMDKETIWSYPLVKYAGRCFADHVEFVDVLSHITNGLDDLLDPDKPHFKTLLWLEHGDWVGISFVWHSGPDSYPGETLSEQSNPEHPVPIYPPRIFPLYYVLALGYTCLAQHLILKRLRDLDASDKYGTTALHIAAFLPDYKVVQMIIERTAAIDVRDTEGRTPLHYAMRDFGFGWDHDDGRRSDDDIFHCVQLLLDHGASAEAQNNHGSTPLHVAASQMSREIVQLLIENGTNIDLRNNSGRTALHGASQRRQPDIIQLILNHNAEVDALDGDGSTPLYLTIPEWRLTASKPYLEAACEAVQLLLEHGAKINLQNHMGRTALHRASQTHHLDIIRLILNYGADVDVPDSDGSTPLHLAISGISRELAKIHAPSEEIIREAGLETVAAVQLLLKHGANINLQDHMGRTALHKASQCGDAGMMELILDHNADVDALDHDGLTPLHLAIYKGHLETVQLLLKRGASVALRNENGQTALHRASECGQSDIIQLLLNHNAEVDAPDNDGSTPLHLAISGGRVAISEGSPAMSKGSPAISEVSLISLGGAAPSVELSVKAVQLLLKHGANINLRNHTGQTALHKASQSGHLGILVLILKDNADVDAFDLNGLTPLHLAISEALPETVQLLLKHGASVHTQNNQGETIFQAASARGLQEITEMLSLHVQRE